MTNKRKIGIIYGGKSGEHDVSLQTALAVTNAFDLSKYEIYPFYITKQGAWRAGNRIDTPPTHVDQLKLTAETADREASSLVALRSLTSASNAFVSNEDRSLDVVFPLMHGTYGEDGTIQGMLEIMDIPYVGAGVLASAVGMDKITMKKVFAQAGLPQCVYRHFTKSQWEKNRGEFLLEISVTVGYPCFVKPANLGSSVGVSKASDEKELIGAVEEALRYDRKVIVEEFVEAREIELAVLGNDEPEVSIPGEIVSSSDFYDYKAKYVDGTSQMIIPADLPQELVTQLQEQAIQAYLAIDGSGLSRVDFFVGKKDGRVFINEINTMPGFTPYSMYPLLWKESGKSYGQLLDELIGLALERHDEKKRIQYEF